MLIERIGIPHVWHVFRLCSCIFANELMCIPDYQLCQRQI